MILGANVIDQIILPEMRRGSNGQPSAIRTIFGWTITGPYSSSTSAVHVMYHADIFSNTNELLRAFWESQETTSSGTSPLTPEEKAVVEHYSLNHKLNETGRYQVALPKRDPRILHTGHLSHNVFPLGKILRLESASMSLPLQNPGYSFNIPHLTNEDEYLPGLFDFFTISKFVGLKSNLELVHF